MHQRNSINYTVSRMAKSHQSLVQGKIGEMIECSICVEIYTNPKILPCVHTFCLSCLETYGKDKQPGDQLTCPICRNEFAIPNGGLCRLPSNFFIGNMVEIGKLSMTPEKEAMCNICPEGEEIAAKLLCIDCEQILCERCSKSHKKTKSSQHHQIVEIGSQLNTQELNFRSSYCEHHPKELIKMYCHDDSVAICLICCVESHQSHKCVNVDKAAGEFTKRMKEDLKKVTFRLPECDAVEKNLDEYKEEFKQEISRTEEAIHDTVTKLKKLIDQHVEELFRNLKSVADKNLKSAEITRQEVERFRAMIESYSRYSEDLLSQGSPVDICRAADQMHTRANELEKLPSNCSGDRFRYDAVDFHPSNFDNFLKQCRSNNAVGELIVSESQERTIKFGIESTGSTEETNESSKREQASSVFSEMVDISNIPPDVTKEMLTIVLKQFSGYDVESLDYNQELNAAVVKFTNPVAVDCLVSIGNLIYKGKRLSIERHVEKGNRGITVPREKTEEDPASSNRSIFVSKISSKLSKDFLELFFGNKRSDIEDVDFDTEKGTAVIMFKDSRVADALIARGNIRFGRHLLLISRPSKP